jgi:hypothetical protein
MIAVRFIGWRYVRNDRLLDFDKALIGDPPKRVHVISSGGLCREKSCLPRREISRFARNDKVAGLEP